MRIINIFFKILFLILILQSCKKSDLGANNPVSTISDTIKGILVPTETVDPITGFASEGFFTFYDLKGKKKWEVSGIGVSWQPEISYDNNVIYISNFTYNPITKATKYYFSAIDVNTGNILWKNSPTFSLTAPVVRKDTLYATTNDNIIAFDKNGKYAWAQYINNLRPLISKVDGDVVYLCTDVPVPGSSLVNCYLHAFNLKERRIVWSYSLGQQNSNANVVFNDTHVILRRNSGFIGINKSTGIPEWSINEDTYDNNFIFDEKNIYLFNSSKTLLYGYNFSTPYVRLFKNSARPTTSMINVKMVNHNLYYSAADTGSSYSINRIDPISGNTIWRKIKVKDVLASIETNNEFVFLDAPSSNLYGFIIYNPETLMPKDSFSFAKNGFLSSVRIKVIMESGKIYPN